MKTILLFLLLPFLVNGQSFYDTPHNMTNFNNTAKSKSNCSACHIEKSNNIFQKALWQKSRSKIDSISYTMYSSSTFNANGSPYPDGSSKLCLSCHDGSVSIDKYNMGTDLSNDHPISFFYDQTLIFQDNCLNNINTIFPNISGTINDVMLEKGKLQCTSCHNPHDNTFSSFLIAPNENSELCLTCHSK